MNRVVVGLAEPGIEFLGSRGNIGAMALDAIADTHHVDKFRLSDIVKDVEFSTYTIPNGNHTDVVWLIRPLAEKAKVGFVVAQLFERFGFPKNSLIVLYDDADFDIGQVRLRDTGGAGGHAGVRSIMDQLAYKDFDRIRLGTGNPKGKQSRGEYLREQFAPDEHSRAISAAYHAALAVDHLILNGLRPTQKAFNKTASQVPPTETAFHKKPIEVTVLPKQLPKIERAADTVFPKKKLELTKVVKNSISPSDVAPATKIVRNDPDWMQNENRMMTRQWTTKDDEAMADIALVRRHGIHTMHGSLAGMAAGMDPYFKFNH